MKNPEMKSEKKIGCQGEGLGKWVGVGCPGAEGGEKGVACGRRGGKLWVKGSGGGSDLSAISVQILSQGRSTKSKRPRETEKERTSHPENEKERGGWTSKEREGCERPFEKPSEKS